MTERFDCFCTKCKTHTDDDIARVQIDFFFGSYFVSKEGKAKKHLKLAETKIS